jgi:ABC-type uncharacterized transport system ATPase subunit
MDPAPPLLQTAGLSKRFGGVEAVRGVDFALAEGELRCIIGPNGAGKSTFFKLLTGQLRPTSGRVLFRGRDITGATSSQIARLGVGIKMQVPSVFDGLDLRENLRLAARRRHGERAALELVDRTLGAVGLPDLTDRRVGELAHGERALVELAIVLAAEPDLLLLDEPTAGMTSEEVARTAGLIRDINRTRALIVVEHDMGFIRMIARRVTVFHQGAVLVEDTMDNLMRNPMVRDIYLGRRAAEV